MRVLEVMLAFALSLAVFAAECAGMAVTMIVAHIPATSSWWLVPFAVVALTVGVVTERYVRL